ncbi:MAG TPA: hypothetical protein VNW04_18525, partial [Puia sp.]|nr:hypothetical protein [Puia sp.]
TEITLNNASFSTYTSLATIISGATGFKSMEKSFSSGVGNYSVTHSGSTDDLLTQMTKKLGTTFEVTGEESGKIEIKVK